MERRGGNYGHVFNSVLASRNVAPPPCDVSTGRDSRWRLQYRVYQHFLPENDLTPAALLRHLQAMAQVPQVLSSAVQVCPVLGRPPSTQGLEVGRNPQLSVLSMGLVSQTLPLCSPFSLPEASKEIWIGHCTWCCPMLVTHRCRWFVCNG